MCVLLTETGVLKLLRRKQNKVHQQVAVLARLGFLMCVIIQCLYSVSSSAKLNITKKSCDFFFENNKEILVTALFQVVSPTENME